MLKMETHFVFRFMEELVQRVRMKCNTWMDKRTRRCTCTMTVERTRWTHRRGACGLSVAFGCETSGLQTIEKNGPMGMVHNGPQWSDGNRFNGEEAFPLTKPSGTLRAKVCQ